MIPIWGFPKTGCTILGVPILLVTIFWGLFWGLPILGIYHIIPISSLYEALYSNVPQALSLKRQSFEVVT